MKNDPNWPRAGGLFQRPGRGPADLVVLGAPMRLGSISGGGFDLTPDAVRRTLNSFSTSDGESDLRSLIADDAGDLSIAELRPADAFRPIRDGVGKALSSTRGPVVLLGGDNSITYPGVVAMAEHASIPLERAGLLTLDAHHDLRDTSEGLTNGNPVRALLEEGLPGRNVVQIGIQPFANSPAYTQVAEEAGIRVIPVDEARHGVDPEMVGALADLSERCDAIYVDLDVDVLDRAFAPGCPGSRPGGLMPWELHRAAFRAGAHPKVAALDIVEVDPERDVGDVTVMNAARCLLSFVSGLLTRG